MLTKFMCQGDYLQKLEILDFDPPEAGDDRRYPALINDQSVDCHVHSIHSNTKFACLKTHIMPKHKGAV